MKLPALPAPPSVAEVALAAALTIAWATVAQAAEAVAQELAKLGVRMIVRDFVQTDVLIIAITCAMVVAA
jgi:hypothetical protein